MHRHWRQRSWSALLVGLALVATAVTHAATVTEHELKLALIYNLTKFVTWPSERESSPTFVLCVLGESPFESALESVVGLTVKERPITVRHDSAETSTDGCDLLFVSRSEGDRVDEILAPLADTPVLTVSDAPGFALRGGIVELKNLGKRIGFEINVAAYRRAELAISSQVLALATLVGTPESSGR
jgi:hypothetical protein